MESWGLLDVLELLYAELLFIWLAQSTYLGVLMRNKYGVADRSVCMDHQERHHKNSDLLPPRGLSGQANSYVDIYHAIQPVIAGVCLCK